MKDCTMSKKHLFSFLFILFFSLPSFATEEDFLIKNLDNLNCEKPIAHTEYNYESTEKVPIKLRINKKIKDNNVYEGQELEFVVLYSTVYKKKVIIPKKTLVKARVETVISSGMNGIPASIIIGNFIIPNVPQSKISNTYEVIGQDRSLVVFPLKWALTILPPTGSLTNFIMGGHAKLSTDDTIEIYYYPNWI